MLKLPKNELGVIEEYGIVDSIRATFCGYTKGNNNCDGYCEKCLFSSKNKDKFEEWLVEHMKNRSHNV